MTDRDELFPALLEMARLAGDYDARAPRARAEDRFGSLDAVLALHDLLWEGRPHGPSRVTETTALVDAFMDAYRAATGGATGPLPASAKDGTR